MDLVYASFREIRAADIESDGESFYHYRSDLEVLALGTYLEGQRVFEAALDVKVGTFSCGSHLGLSLIHI